MKIKQCNSYKDTQYVRFPRFSFIIKCRKWNIVYRYDNNSENSKDIRLKVIQKSTCCKCSHLTINPTLIHSFHSFALSWSGSHSLSQEHWEQHIATKLLMPLFVSQVCGNSWPVHDRLQFDPDEHWPRTGSGTRTWAVFGGKETWVRGRDTSWMGHQSIPGYHTHAFTPWGNSV